MRAFREEVLQELAWIEALPIERQLRDRLAAPFRQPLQRLAEMLTLVEIILRAMVDGIVTRHTADQLDERFVVALLAVQHLSRGPEIGVLVHVHVVDR